MKKATIAALSLMTLLLAGPAPAAPATASLPVVASGPVVDTPVLLEDVRTLASIPFAGRGTGSEGSKLAQAYLIKRFEQVGLQPFGASYSMPFSFTKPRVATGTNLVGFIKGSKDPQRYMVVSAHYDHLGVRAGVVYPGADDNASGVAAMLAIAAYFKQHAPLNTVVFAAFDGEELGLRGAEAFVKALPFPREKLALNLNLDMVSRNDHNEIYVAGIGHHAGLKALVSGPAARSTLKLTQGHDTPDLGPDDDWTNSSDHGPFHKLGVPFLYFGVEDHADYHHPSDTFDKINPVFYSQVTSLLIDVAATADQNLPADK